MKPGVLDSPGRPSTTQPRAGQAHAARLWPPANLPSPADPGGDVPVASRKCGIHEKAAPEQCPPSKVGLGWKLWSL